MPKTYDLFKVKLFLDSLAQGYGRKKTETNISSIEDELKECLSAEKAMMEQLYSNKREINQIEDELKRIENWHNELLQHPDLSTEKKQELKQRIETTKTKLHSIKKHL